jgi:hypothetical protein
MANREKSALPAVDTWLNTNFSWEGWRVAGPNMTEAFIFVMPCGYFIGRSLEDRFKWGRRGLQPSQLKFGLVPASTAGDASGLLKAFIWPWQTGERARPGRSRRRPRRRHGRVNNPMTRDTFWYARRVRREGASNHARGGRAPQDWVLPDAIGLIKSSYPKSNPWIQIRLNFWK